MARKLKESLLQPDEGAPGVPRIAGFSEAGYTGLKFTAKQILEERDKRFRMPKRIETIDEMLSEPVISAALEMYKMLMARPEWTIEPPVGASATQKERAKFVQSCLDDMDDQTWFSFVQSALSYLDYGFCVVEKVFKRRTKKNSKHSDGLVGISKLAVRSQSTISGWLFSDDGRELLGVEQSLKNIVYADRFSNAIASTIEIPREKFMLFRSSPKNDNPEGTPILKSAYVPFRYKRAVEEAQAIGVTRDLAGILVMKAPADVFSPNASAEQKASFEELKRVLRNVSTGEQQGLLLPSTTQGDNGQGKEHYSAELLSSSGARAFDTQAIIQQLQTQMLISMFADMLQLGNNGQGSFSLADGKLGMVEASVSYKLRELSEVINQQLIPDLYRFNGWDDKEYCKAVPGVVSEMSADEFGKLIQRVSAVGAVEMDRKFLNKIREHIGIDTLAEDVEPREEYMPQATSRSGDGMASGLNSGTGDATGSSGDSSTNNADNAA